MATLLLDRPALPADDATRREFMIGGLSLAAMLAGCGTNRQSEAPSSPTSASRTIRHQHGTTDVTAAPERIVTLGFIDHDAVLALAFKPVAVRDSGWIAQTSPAILP